MIGEDEYRGKGNGEKAMLLLIDFTFNKLKLHKLNLGVVKENVHAVDLYRKLGFKIEGVMKDEIYSKGRFYDFLSMALFAKDFKKK